MRFSEEEPSSLVVPSNAHSIEGFEEWRESDQFPAEGRVDLCAGEVLVDMSPERVESHVELKGEIYLGIRNLLKTIATGQIYGDGATYTHVPSGLVTEPDALYFSYESFRKGRVQGGVDQGSPLGFRGSVDWILEVVSPSSQRKDRKKLFAGYAKAGVREYWIAEATAETVFLEVFCLGDDGYVLAANEDGWQRSSVFDTDFRLDFRRSPVGLPIYELCIREGGGPARFV